MNFEFDRCVNQLAMRWRIESVWTTEGARTRAVAGVLRTGSLGAPPKTMVQLQHDVYQRFGCRPALAVSPLTVQDRPYRTIQVREYNLRLDRLTCWNWPDHSRWEP